MYIVRTEESFDSAHFLANYDGKCRNVHGHRWRVVLEVASEALDEGGMVVDFTDLKRELKEFVDGLDHALIVERNALRYETLKALQEEKFKLVEVDFRPTAENFAKYFYEAFRAKGYSMRAVEVYETPNNVARYEEGVL